MTIYLDLVVLLNFVFDFLILKGVNYILKRNVGIIRVIVGTVFGSLTLVLLFVNFNIIIYKILVSIIMLLLTFGYKDIKYFIKNFVYFYMVSMLIGGAVEILRNQFIYSTEGLSFKSHNLGYSYIIVLIVSVFIFIKYLKAFNYLKTNYSNYYKCKVVFDEKEILLNAFLDTGNKLRDPYTKKSIILISLDKLTDIRIRSPVYVPFNTLNNHGLLKCIKADKIEINGMESDNFLVGISDNNFFMDGIDCIINTDIMEDLK